ncbi:1715_t:CDS:2, partial [Racocetra persica]
LSSTSSLLRFSGSNKSVIYKNSSKDRKFKKQNLNKTCNICDTNKTGETDNISETNDTNKTNDISKTDNTSKSSNIGKT